MQLSFLNQPPTKRRRLNINIPVERIHSNNGGLATNGVNLNSGTGHTNNSLIVPMMGDNNDNSRQQQLSDFKLQLTNLLQMFPPFADVLALQKDQQEALTDLYAVFSCGRPEGANNVQPPMHPMDPNESARAVNAIQPIYTVQPVLPPFTMALGDKLPQHQPFTNQPTSFAVLPISPPVPNPPAPPSASVLQIQSPLSFDQSQMTLSAKSNLFPTTTACPIGLNTSGPKHQYQLALPVIGNCAIESPLTSVATPSVAYPKSDGTASTSDTVTTCSRRTSPRGQSSLSSSVTSPIIEPTNPNPNVNVAVVSKFCYETVPDSKQVGIYCIADDVLRAVKTKEIVCLR